MKCLDCNQPAGSSFNRCEEHARLYFQNTADGISLEEEIHDHTELKICPVCQTPIKIVILNRDKRLRTHRGKCQTIMRKVKLTEYREQKKLAEALS